MKLFDCGNSERGIKVKNSCYPTAIENYECIYENVLVVENGILILIKKHF